MEALLTEILKQLPPIVALVIILLITAVVYLWRRNIEQDKINKAERDTKDSEIERLRNERNTAVQQVIDKSSAENKALTEKVFEMQRKTLESQSQIANNIAANTVATNNMSRLVENINIVLTARKK